MKVRRTEVADGVINICFAFNKRKEFKFDAEIEKTFLKFYVDIFRETYF